MLFVSSFLWSRFNWFDPHTWMLWVTLLSLLGIVINSLLLLKDHHILLLFTWASCHIMTVRFFSFLLRWTSVQLNQRRGTMSLVSQIHAILSRLQWLFHLSLGLVVAASRYTIWIYGRDNHPSKRLWGLFRDENFSICFASVISNRDLLLFFIILFDFRGLNASRLRGSIYTTPLDVIGWGALWSDVIAVMISAALRV